MSEEHNPDQLPLSNTEPAAVEEPEDLSAYMQYIKHDNYRNTISVSGTQLLLHFHKSAPYMEDIHRKQLVDLESRMTKHQNRNVSRTAHCQVSAIVNRYLPKIKEQNTSLAADLQMSVDEARKIETLCGRIMDEAQRKRTMGNVRFVKELVPPKKS